MNTQTRTRTEVMNQARLNKILNEPCYFGRELSTIRKMVDTGTFTSRHHSVQIYAKKKVNLEYKKLKQPKDHFYLCRDNGIMNEVPKMVYEFYSWLPDMRTREKQIKQDQDQAGRDQLNQDQAQTKPEKEKEMSTNTGTKTKKSKKRVVEIVTQQVIDALESGTVPWDRPWNGPGFHRNLASKKPYRGFNQWLLQWDATQKGFECPYWATFKQIKNKGGHVRKGEHGTQITYFNIVRVKDKSGAVNDKGETLEVNIPLMRYYTVFNLEQADGIEIPPMIESKIKTTDASATDAAGAVVAKMQAPPKIRHYKQDRAFYRPSTDSVHMPEMDQFKTDAGYFGTLFHELTHSTGHKKRLDREYPENHGVGSPGYAREELTAELGSAMLLNMVGFEGKREVERTAAYIDSWLKALNDDRGLIIKAANQAYKAVECITGEIE